MSSLTIREGISTCRSCMCGAPWFPHYTWGYIVYDELQRKNGFVPSLYVRVYRHIRKGVRMGKRSLTIREGISDFFSAIIDQQTFPHYTWGYIENNLFSGTLAGVPSLYVRVYRCCLHPRRTGKSSLTIREGISAFQAVRQSWRLFPHYTWGYIVNSRLLKYRQPVPSLYVRVYRFSRIFCRT